MQNVGLPLAKPLLDYSRRLIITSIQELLAICIEQGASDLHLVAGQVPRLRVSGILRPLPLPTLAAEATETAIGSLMSEPQKARWRDGIEVDFAYEAADKRRFRVSAFRQMQGAQAVFRCIPQLIPSLAELGFNANLEGLTERSSGLICVTGSVGSGKSTTLAALVDLINRTQHKHIVTIEDPIEFNHENQLCLITQRAVGEHTHSFQAALRNVLRADPNVILIGELRDYETVSMALSAAQTGHLVLTSLHTQSAAGALHRIVDFFPAEEKTIATAMLSECLQAVITQKLIRAKKGGRAMAYELLIATPAIRHLIREMKVAQINAAIQTGSSFGMQSLDQHLVQLAREGLIENESQPKALKR